MRAKPLSMEELAVVQRRHSPFPRGEYTFCTRDFDELWPCDAARLLATIGEAYIAGGLAEYREKRR